MSLRTRFWFGLLFLIGLPAAHGAVPDAYRKLWTDPAVVKRIDEGIETNRKRDAAITVKTAAGQPLADAKIEVKQVRHEFLFGCNGFVLGQLDTAEKNAKYEAAFVKLFNFVTVPFYWEGTEPAQGELRYQEGCRDMWRRPPPDRYLPFAEKHHLTLKGHPLLWHAYNPPWLPKDADQLRLLYQKRFAEISQRYAAKIPIWDVVNESLVCPKAYPLYTPERSYVAWAFQEAHKVFLPQNTLMINEVTEVSHHAIDTNRYLPQVTALQAGGANVKGIGFQFHFFSGDALKKAYSSPTYSPASMLDVYQAFTRFQLPMYVTEITIPTPAEDGPAVQAEVTTNYYKLWFSAANMAGITWWNLGDGTAVKGENKALGGLLDDNFEPKPSYHALDKLINHDWKTNATLKTDAQGAAKFRGFCGHYTVRVTAGGKTQEFELDVASKGPTAHALTLKP